MYVLRHFSSSLFNLSLGNKGFHISLLLHTLLSLYRTFHPLFICHGLLLLQDNVTIFVTLSLIPHKIKRVLILLWESHDFRYMYSKYLQLSTGHKGWSLQPMLCLGQSYQFLHCPVGFYHLFFSTIRFQGSTFFKWCLLITTVFYYVIHICFCCPKYCVLIHNAARERTLKWPEFKSQGGKSTWISLPESEDNQWEDSLHNICSVKAYWICKQINS